MLIADKINDLFETIRKPDGRPYSNQEVADSADGLSRSYLSRLRKGVAENPSFEIVSAIARHFNVSMDYFIDTDMGGDKLLSLSISKRARSLSPQAQRVLLGIIEGLESLDAET